MSRLYNFVYISLSVVIVLTGQFISCSDSGTNPGDKEFAFPDTMVSFNQHVKPMFEAKCTIENACHSPGNLDNPLFYTVLLDRNQLLLHRLSSTGELLVDVAVDPRYPDQSRLYLILLEGYPTAVNAMPPNRGLYSGEIRGIRQWIKEGAPE